MSSTGFPSSAFQKKWRIRENLFDSRRNVRRYIPTSQNIFVSLIILRVARIELASHACPEKYRARCAMIFFEDPVARSERTN